MLLDTICYRISGHSPSDASSYRSKEELADARENRDCLKIMRHKLVSGKKASARELDAIDRESVQLIDSCREAAKAAAFPDSSTMTQNTYVSY